MRMRNLFLLAGVVLLSVSVVALAADAPSKPTPTSQPAASQPVAHPDCSAWEKLFADDLSNAIFSKGVWSNDKGELTATKDECIWSKQQHENFILDLEFKNAEAANSGVLIYCTDVRNWIPNAIEVQILDDYAAKWAKSPKNWFCGAVFGRQAPAKQAVKKAGEWNRMTITCKGPSITVLLNGELVNECDLKQFTSAKKNPDGTDVLAFLGGPLAPRPTKGHIGLQGKHGGAAICFRNVRIAAITPEPQ
jgi:hypothetical protein